MKSEDYAKSIFTLIDCSGDSTRQWLIETVSHIVERAQNEAKEDMRERCTAVHPLTRGNIRTVPLSSDEIETDPQMKLDMEGGIQG